MALTCRVELTVWESTVSQDQSTLQSDPACTASGQKVEPVKRTNILNMLQPQSPLKKTQNKQTQNTNTQKKVGFDLQTAETHSSYVESLAVSSISEKIIECFCSTIQEITETQTSVGVLVYNDSKHQVWVPRAPLTSARMLSLAELLSLPEPPMEERLKLAVRLASSVLQFHTSGWLRERWGKQDIYFIQRDSSQSQTPSLDTPVVPQSFTQEPSPQIGRASCRERV